jgi:hypothetical protein
MTSTQTTSAKLTDAQRLRLLEDTIIDHCAGRAPRRSPEALEELLQFFRRDRTRTSLGLKLGLPADCYLSEVAMSLAGRMRIRLDVPQPDPFA